MTSSKIGHKIKGRGKEDRERGDIFITPIELCKKHISLVPDIYHKEDTLWLDPFKATGNYYNNFPLLCTKEWTEIREGRDFYDYTCPDNTSLVIVSNPPYSILDNIFKKSIELKPKIISYLLHQGSITPKRLEIMHDNGYVLIATHLMKVFKWYGISQIMVWELKGKQGKVDYSYDRTVWKT
jgi:hypothetical protein